MKLTDEHLYLLQAVKGIFEQPDIVSYYGDQVQEGPTLAELRLLSLIPDSGSVLDLGCGAGRISFYLHGLGYRVTGVDVSDTMLESAQSLALSRGIDVRFIRSEGILLPFGDATFDCVVGFKVIGYIPTRELRAEYLREIYRVLKPGGLFLLSQRIVPDEQLGDAYDEYYDSTPASRFTIIEEGDTFPLGMGYVHWFTRSSLLDELQASNFIVEILDDEEMPDTLFGIYHLPLVKPPTVDR